MSKSRQSLALLVIVAVIIGGTFLLIVSREHSVVSENLNDIATITKAATSSLEITYVEPELPAEYAAKGWILIHNKKHGYSYYRPSEMRLNYFYVENFAWEVEKKTLETFVWEIFNFNRSDDNPNIDDETATEPKKVDINGITAYEMFITGVFDAPDRGFLVDLPSRFLFMESPSGAKVMVYYPVDSRPDSLYNEIIGTFRLSETLIPAKQEPAAWTEISQGQYKMSYPSNLLKKLEDSTLEGVYLTSTEDDVYGGAFIGVEDKVFDPNNIEGMYGKIEDAKKVSIQGRDWYRYGSGDAGCGSDIYETGLDSGQTLKVSFSTCPEVDVYPIAEDELLKLKILETFIF